MKNAMKCLDVWTSVPSDHTSDAVTHVGDSKIAQEDINEIENCMVSLVELD